MFILAVHNAEAHKVIIANMKPQAQPANSDEKVQEKVNRSDPAEAKILLNPALMPIASSKPSNAPTTPAIAAITTPSNIANALTSERVTPMARRTPSSLRLASANIKTMVSTSKTPAAIVNVPKTRNIPEITPDDSAAALAAYTLTAVNRKLISSLSERSSNH